MTDAFDVLVPVSPLDSAICAAVSKLDLAASRGATVAGDEMHTVCRDLWRAMETDRQRRAEMMLAPAAGAPRSDFTGFHNRLRILLSMDRAELIAAGVLAADDLSGWARFLDNPFRFFCSASEEQAAALWTIIIKMEGRGA